MKKTILLLVIFSYIQATKAQLHMGLHSDNYAGIYNINFQPADIVDSRYRFDLNIYQTEFTLANNYIGLKKLAILQSDVAFQDPDFSDNYLKENIDGSVKKMYLQSNTMLPLSFYFQFGKKMKNALGFSSRFRYNINIDGIEEGFATQIYSGLKKPNLIGVPFQNKDFSVQTSAWAEYGITYGREIFDMGEHYLKGALTGKLNQGIISLYAYSDNLDAGFPTDSTATVKESDFSYGLSTNILDFSTSTNPTPVFEFRPSFSVDFGFVYEWRPKINDYKYELDGNSDVLDPKKNKYKLKASLSFVDVGNLRFKRSPYSKVIHANFNDVSTNELGDLIKDVDQDGLSAIQRNFNNSPSNLGTISNVNEPEYLQRLPFTINAMIDYHIWKGFYVNGTASIAPEFKKDENKTIGISQYSLTPRYEHKWAGVQLPISVDGVGRGHLGLGLRAGPIILGTNDIIPLLAGKDYNIYGVNFYLGVRIPIFARLKDFDKDHVSNKMDNCKKEKGPWETKGCPDTDGDGITDDKDKCPDIKGVRALDGCPDTDLDGITDSNDECPEVAGVKEFKGCPDTDKDGIKDSEDECPEVAGIAAFNGCPDTDGDGVKDADDKCPKIAGTIENDGCPYKDTDGDGIKDADDKCPEVAGPVENDGCPYTDTDGDGVIDKEDNCIKTPGPVENKGCPVIKEEVKKVIQTAFENLEFVTAKAQIKGSSYNSLKNLAKVLNENPNFKLRIAGHTDSDGSESSNLLLSKKRATAVKAYLKQYGLKDDRFVIEAYGETQPIASNNTPEGKQKNRRVEMEIIID